VGKTKKRAIEIIAAEDKYLANNNRWEGNRLALQLDAGHELEIDGIKFKVAEHPAAPGIPYGQEGRQATVYKLISGQGNSESYHALKIFKSRFRVPSLVSLAERIDKYANLPGLQVCRRTVIVPQKHEQLLEQYPDFVYAVLMPWIEGATLFEVMLDQTEISPAQSLSLARSMAQVLAEMEQRGLAHCDLSGPNILLPGIKSSTVLIGKGDKPLIELVDVEQLYGPNLDRPEDLPSGSPGYAPRYITRDIWETKADRFAGAVIIAEMLGWCDERVRHAAWGESYFEPQEVQEDGARYSTMYVVLRERWGDDVAELFALVWHSESLYDCPTFGEWLVRLPKAVLHLERSAEEEFFAYPEVKSSYDIEPAYTYPNDDLEKDLPIGKRLREQRFSAARAKKKKIPSGKQVSGYVQPIKTQTDNPAHEYNQPGKDPNVAKTPKTNSGGGSSWIQIASFLIIVSILAYAAIHSANIKEYLHTGKWGAGYYLTMILFVVAVGFNVYMLIQNKKANRPQALSPAPHQAYKLCPHCGAKNNPSSDFCSQCYARMTKPTVAREIAPAPAYESPAHYSSRGDYLSAQSSNHGIVLAAPYDSAKDYQAVVGQAYPQARNDVATMLLQPPVIPILIVNRNGRKDTVYINKPEFVIGRNQEIVDYYEGGNNNVGRTHAKIVTQNGRYYVVDLSSKNGSYINGNRLISGDPTPLSFGDRITLANADYIFSKA